MSEMHLHPGTMVTGKRRQELVKRRPNLSVRIATWADEGQWIAETMWPNGWRSRMSVMLPSRGLTTSSGGRDIKGIRRGSFFHTFFGSSVLGMVEENHLSCSGANEPRCFADLHRIQPLVLRLPPMRGQDSRRFGRTEHATSPMRGQDRCGFGRSEHATSPMRGHDSRGFGRAEHATSPHEGSRQSRLRPC